jgi:hypothetical protein
MKRGGAYGKRAKADLEKANKRYKDFADNESD